MSKDITSLQEGLLENSDVSQSEGDSTYLRLEYEDGSIMEMDFVFMRQKGESTKFLEIILSGIDPQSGKKQQARKVIESEVEFKRLQEYFENLKWK